MRHAARPVMYDNNLERARARGFTRFIIFIMQGTIAGLFIDGFEKFFLHRVRRIS